MPYAVRTIARSRASARLRPLRSPSGLPPRPQPRLVSAWTYPILPSPKGCPIISCGGGGVELRALPEDGIRPRIRATPLSSDSSGTAIARSTPRANVSGMHTGQCLACSGMRRAISAPTSIATDTRTRHSSVETQAAYTLGSFERLRQSPRSWTLLWMLVFKK